MVSLIFLCGNASAGFGPRSSMATSFSSFWPVWRDLGGADSRVMSVEDEEVLWPVSNAELLRLKHFTEGLQFSTRNDNDPGNRPYHAASDFPLGGPSKVAISSTALLSNKGTIQVSDSIAAEEFHWMICIPPSELLDAPRGTAMEIESLLEASVERVQERLAEEKSSQESKLSRWEGDDRAKKATVKLGGQRQNDDLGLQLVILLNSFLNARV